MERFIKGVVVVVPFPFSNLAASKRRPALVIAALDGDDVILCQITSQAIGDRYALPLREHEFQTGGLKQLSNIRPNRLFTADSHIVSYRAGRLKEKNLGGGRESGGHYKRDRLNRRRAHSFRSQGDRGQEEKWTEGFF